MQKKYRLPVDLRRSLLVFAILSLFSGVLSPLYSSLNVSAAAITQRSLTLGTAQISTATTYTYSFVPGTAGAIQSLKMEACTTAVGTCTAPTGLSFTSAAGGTVGGSWTTATNFAVNGTGGGTCTPAANVLCAARTQAVSETASGVRTVQFTTITNPSGASCATVNCTFFVRITTYSDTAWATAVDTGTVASSTVASFTVNASIAEVLTFCIGATTINDGTTAPPACSSVSGTSVSLGALNPSNVSITPVTTLNGGDGNNGIAQISTNASNGAAVTYSATQQAGTNQLGTLRVAGAACNASTVNTDQCVNAVGTTQSTLTAGTERFGMTVAAVNCASTTAYTCTFAGGT